MAEVFGNSTTKRGCFALARVNAGGARGLSVNMPGSGALPGGVAEPIMALGFSMKLAESLQFNRCFGNRTYAYAFGHDPSRSNVSVNMIGFLIDKNAYSGVVDDTIQAYKDSTAYTSGKLATLMVGGGKALQGYVVGLSSSTVDPQHSLQSFSLHLAVPGL